MKNISYAFWLRIIHSVRESELGGEWGGQRHMMAKVKAGNTGD